MGREEKGAQRRDLLQRIISLVRKRERERVRRHPPTPGTPSPGDAVGREGPIHFSVSLSLSYWLAEPADARTGGHNEREPLSLPRSLRPDSAQPNATPRLVSMQRKISFHHCPNTGSLYFEVTRRGDYRIQGRSLLPRRCSRTSGVAPATRPAARGHLLAIRKATPERPPRPCGGTLHARNPFPYLSCVHRKGNTKTTTKRTRAFRG